MSGLYHIFTGKIAPPRRTITAERSIFPCPSLSTGPVQVGSSTNRSGQPQNSGSASLAMSGINISGDRREVPILVCPTPTSVLCNVIKNTLFIPLCSATGGGLTTTKSSISSGSASMNSDASRSAGLGALGAAGTARRKNRAAPSFFSSSVATFSSPHAFTSSGMWPPFTSCSRMEMSRDNTRRIWVCSNHLMLERWIVLARRDWDL